MSNWTNWGPINFFYFLIGAAYLLIWMQVLLFHWRGAFRMKVMWAPVIEGPLLAAIGIVYSFMHGGILDPLFVFLYAIGLLGGLAGVYYHISGVKHYVGGFNLRNVMAGPPFILPVMYTAFSVAMLVVYFAWGA